MLIFDTHRYIKRLVAAGFELKQAEVIVDIWMEMLTILYARQRL